MNKLIQLADLHFGTEDKAALDVAARAIKDIAPSALIICGDLTQRGKRSEFQAASDWLDQFDCPMLVVPGNHDTPLLDMYARVVSPFERHEKYFGHPKPIVTEKFRASGINTARGWQARSNWAEGSVNLDDLAQAISSPEPAQKSLHLLTCHHPFLSPPGAPMRTSTRRGVRASRALAASPVNVLLTGHVHTPSAHVWRHGDGEYLALSCGTLSTRLREAPPGFNIVTFSDPDVYVETAVISEDDFTVSPLVKYTPPSTK